MAMGSLIIDIVWYGHRHVVLSSCCTHVLETHRVDPEDRNRVGGLLDGNLHHCANTQFSSECFVGMCG